MDRSKMKIQISMAILTMSLLVLGFIIHGLSTGADVQPSPTSKNIISYWSDVSLNGDLDQTLFKDTTCYSSEKNFLSCIKAIESVSTFFQILPQPTGYFKVMSATDYKSIKNEKTHLKKWSDFFKHHHAPLNISFSRSWKMMKEKLFSDRYKSYFAAIAINGYLSIFEDPHTYLAPRQWFLDRVTSQKQNLETFGFAVERNEKGYEVTKSDIEELKKEDILLKFNHRSVSGLFIFELQDLVAERLFKETEVTLLRGGQEVTIQLKSKNLNINSVEGQLAKGNPHVGYIKMRRFSLGTCESLKHQITQFQKMTSLKGLILDLRNNPGGIISEAGCSAGLFLGPQKLIYSLKNKEGDLISDQTTETYVSNESIQFDGTLMVLVNEETASAAEILAGVLKDYKRAQIVGNRTFGKGSYQVGQVWSENSNVLFFKTTGLYFLPSGESPQKNGIEPDLYLIKKKSRSNTVAAVEKVSSLSDILPLSSSGENQYWSAIDSPRNVSKDLLSESLRALHEARVMNSLGDNNFQFQSDCQKLAIGGDAKESLEIQTEVAEKLFQCVMISKSEGLSFETKN